MPDFATSGLLVLASAVLGILSGFLGGLFGIGGGVIVIPLLAIVFGMNQQLAQGTALVMVVPNILLALIRYRQRIGLDLRIAATLGCSAIVAAYPVARIATGLDPHVLRLEFAAFLTVLPSFVAYRTWRGRFDTGPKRPPLPWGFTAIVGLIGGAISGLFGVGGAFIVPPALGAFFGIRQVEGQGLALTLVLPGTVIALITYAGAGQVDWLHGAILAVGGTAAISVGVTMALRLPELWLRLGFCGVLVLCAALLAWRG